MVPGLVDGHTHPVWAGDRVAEFAMKLAGATYMQVSSFHLYMHVSSFHPYMHVSSFPLLHEGQLLSIPTCRSAPSHPYMQVIFFSSLHAGQLFFIL